MHDELKKNFLKNQEEHKKKIEKFVKKSGLNSKKIELDFNVLPNNKLSSEIVKGLKENNQIKFGIKADLIFQTKLEKLEKLQTVYEVKQNMKRAEFENYLTKIDMIEQCGSSFGLAIRKKLELVKEIKERKNNFKTL